MHAEITQTLRQLHRIHTNNIHVYTRKHIIIINANELRLTYTYTHAESPKISTNFRENAQISLRIHTHMQKSPKISANFRENAQISLCT